MCVFVYLCVCEREEETQNILIKYLADSTCAHELHVYLKAAIQRQRGVTQALQTHTNTHQHSSVMTSLLLCNPGHSELDTEQQDHFELNESLVGLLNQILFLYNKVRSIINISLINLQ